MRRQALALFGFALFGGCVHSRSGRPTAFAFGTASVALDCAEEALRDVGFHVQGLDVGAASYQRLVPVRRAEDLLARYVSPGTGTIGYVRVFTSMADSTPSYRLRTFGFSTSMSGTDVSAVLHEAGVSAVVTRCGAARTSAALERPRD